VRLSEHESVCGGSVLYISGVHGRRLMKLIVNTHYNFHMTHFQGHRFRGQDRAAMTAGV